LTRFLIAIFLAGLATVILAARFLPLPDHERFRSHIEVLPNGGRTEGFIIRWPQDRISLTDDSVATIPTGTVGAVVFEGAQTMTAVAEVFRLRDIEENVIGIASRIAGRVTGQRINSASVSNWMLMIPGRGTFFLAQEDSVDVSPVRQAGDTRQYMVPSESPSFWSKGSRFQISSGPAPEGRGRIVHGSEEFMGLSGTYTEIWELKRVSGDDRTEGQIFISTLTVSSQ
jgi:hypothetical protein